MVGRRVAAGLLLAAATLLFAAGDVDGVRALARGRARGDWEGRPRGVNWYLNQRRLDDNLAFLEEAPATGVYLCCNGAEVVLDDAGEVKFQFRWKSGSAEAAMEEVVAYRKAGMSEVWLVAGASTEAIWRGLSGEAGRQTIADAAASASAAGLDGFIFDYEPTSNYSKAHVQAYSEFLGEMADGFHLNGLRLGMDSSSWGILQYYGAYAHLPLDIYTTMGSTYFGTDVALDLSRLEKMQEEGTPLNSISAGVGSMVEGHAMKDYNWTQAKLAEFTKGLDEMGVRGVDVWRADLDGYNTTLPWFFESLGAWLEQ